MLPDGESLLFTIVAPGPEIGLKRRGSEEVEVLFPGVGGRYIPTGHIVYVYDEALYAQRFDVDVLETVGGPVLMSKPSATATSSVQEAEHSPGFRCSARRLPRSG